MIRDIALHHGHDLSLKSRLAPYQCVVVEQIATCGTAAAGLHPEICDTCEAVRYVPNSCGNRSCPHCQGAARHAWVAARTAELLPCSYFHAVLTLPPRLRQIAQAFPRVVLDALMKAATSAIAARCKSRTFMNATVGQMTVLHTWRRDLEWHPHVHILVTAGGWNSDTECWVDAPRYGDQQQPFLLPRDVLQHAFLQRLTRLLMRAYTQKKFATHVSLAFPDLTSRATWAIFLRSITSEKAVIHIEPPFAGPHTLLKYLGAYVNRVACSPKRVTYDPITETVTYTWSTNADPTTTQTATIPATDFLVLFARHILPPGFHRIRFRGLWAPASRPLLKRLQAQLHPPTHDAEPAPATTPDTAPATTPQPRPDDLCPCCGTGHFQRLKGPQPRPSPLARKRILAEIRATLHQQPLHRPPPPHAETRITA